MHYDPIKRTLGSVFNRSPFLRKVFYQLLDLLLLRSWHIHKEIRAWMQTDSAGNSILDAGAGYGQYSWYLSGVNTSCRILAVDVKQEQVEDCNDFYKAIGRSNVMFELADLC